MNTAQLTAFLEAARVGSFRAAARNLRLTQPSLTMRIRGLEEEVGAALFHRLGRGVKLTEMGQAFLPFANKAVDDLEQGRRAINNVTGAMGGVLELASAPTFATYSLPKILKQFHDQFPGIAVRLKTGRSSEVLQMVLADKAQIGMGRAVTHPEILTVHLFDEEITLVTHPYHPFAVGGVATIPELAKQPLILYDPTSAFYRTIQELCQEVGIVPEVAMTLDSIEAAKRMVELGLGISFLPVTTITAEVERGALRQVPLKARKLTLPAGLMIKRAQEFSPAAKAFLKVFHETFPMDQEATEFPWSRGRPRSWQVTS